MQTKNNIIKLAERLWIAPTEKNWKRLAKELSGNRIKYYKLVHSRRKLGAAHSASRPYIKLYNAGEVLLTKVPTFKTEGKKKVDVTSYLMKLLNINGIARLGTTNANERVERELKDEEKKAQMIQKLKALGYM
jgi:hypothetical protein